ncbi:hypothetical protein NDU88_003713 [Pleurodeles waltl]|uniref:Uncharacterized protein n=1 Tax=Pleurodeles waltl TaxID=8319 RepID=A0AAV7V2K0_PLEWA|nr:hypothetical protein NDU88_003713 [Pleurodeles waltl]
MAALVEAAVVSVYPRVGQGPPTALCIGPQLPADGAKPRRGSEPILGLGQYVAPVQSTVREVDAETNQACQSGLSDLKHGGIEHYAVGPGVAS